MTLQSHKKHQTTQQNIRLEAGSKSSVISAFALLVCFSVAGVEKAYAEENPLDQLRNRSAVKRWSSIRERLTSRREQRRERLEKRKEGNTTQSQETPVADQNQQPEVKLQSSVPKLKRLPEPQLRWEAKKETNLVPPSASPPQKFGSVYQEQFTIQKEKPVRPIEVSAPVMVHVPLPEPVKVPRPVPQALPVSETRTNESLSAIKTAFAPELSGQPAETSSTNPYQSYFDQYEQIKPLGAIAPFIDYEPDQKLKREDPGRHLCLPGFASKEDVQCPTLKQLPGSDQVPSRNFAHLNYNWVASNVNYNPLYFEDVNLERYGHYHRPLVQPAVSVARFNIQLLGLPYQMAMQPMSKCVYPLGHHRPGDVCAPKYYYRVPLSPKAAMVTAGVYTGLFYIIP